MKIERLRCLKEQFSVPCIKKDSTGELQRRKSGSERLTGKRIWNGPEKSFIGELKVSGTNLYFQTKVRWSLETIIGLYLTEYCVCPPAQRRLSVMIWGCISHYGMGTVTTVNGTINRHKYIEIFKDNLGTDHLTSRGGGGGLWFFASLRNFFSDNTRVRIYNFFVARSANVFSRI